ncbi:MAG: hypothetical protein KF752_13205 [Pirellulaceae bacterium]|nr:hypothetical protein [Pirellulaceae bacterium]
MRCELRRIMWASALLVGAIGQAHAATVNWTIDSANSYIRLSIPDQIVPLGEAGELPLGLRDYVDGIAIASDWTDAGGRRSFVGGTIKTDYVEGSSLAFVAGEQDVNALENNILRPDPAAWNPGPPGSYAPNTGAPAAFGANVILGPGQEGQFVLGDIALRNIDYDVVGTVNLSPGGGGWTTSDIFDVGLKAGAFADLDSFLLSDREVTLDAGATAPNANGSLTITNTGGNNRRLTMVISMPFAVDVEDLPLVATITGVIVANATLPAPASNLVAKRVYHNGFGGGGTPPWNAVNPTKEIIQRGAAPVQVGLINLTNDSRGLNGVVLDYDNLAALGDLTLEYKMSPTGAFNEGANPVSGWANAPAPTSVTLHPDLAAAGGNDRVRILWADNAIANRYLCVKATVGGVTRELYVGHLRGETTGPDATPTFTVSFADITEIKNTVAQIVGAGGPTDIDKNGTVAFADITAMRDNISAQLTRITIPVSP